jgi:hypothetical protein
MSTAPDHRSPVSARPLEVCPACGSDRLEPTAEMGNDEVHYLCHNCWRCWHVALGAYWRVAPTACLGCAYREQCVAAYAAEHPPAPTGS